MRIVNCTPHPISFFKEGIERPDVFFPSGNSIRVKSEHEVTDPIGEYGCVKVRRGECEGIPEPEEGTFFLVSAMVFDATTRSDVIAPDTGPTCIRNEQGQVIGVTRFLRK